MSTPTKWQNSQQDDGSHSAVEVEVVSAREFDVAQGI